MKTRFLLLYLSLFFVKTYATGITTIYPPDNFTSPSFKVNFCWNPILNFTSYRLKIASDAGFTTILKDTLVNQSCVQILFSSSTSSVYWRVTTGNTPAYAESSVSSLSFINPIQDNNIQIWLSADSNVVIEPDSTVDSWGNIIPNGFSASQSSAGLKPKLVSNIAEINNRKAIRFDGADDVLTTNLGCEIGSAYILCNWRGGGTTFPNYNGLITELPEMHGFDSYILIMAAGSTGLNAGYLVGGGRGNPYINNILGGNFTPFSKFKVVSGRRISPNITFSNFSIGQEPGFHASWFGDISEIILSKNNSSSEADSIHRYLFNKYSPPVTLGPDSIAGTSFTDPINLSVPGRFDTYTWSNGSTTNTAAVTTGGQYTINTTDIFGAQTQDNILVYPYRRLNNLTVYLCQGNTLNVNLGINATYSFLWSTGSTANNITITTAGTYTVRVTDKNNTIVFDTLNVVVDNPVLSPSLVGDSLILCEGQKLFAITQTAFDSIRWSTGSTATSITINTGGTYAVQGITTAGCVLNKTFHVRIAGKAPIANFITSPLCDSAATLFTDLSTPPSPPPVVSLVSWSWGFGDGNTANTQSPSNVYNHTGTYTISLKVITSQGCSDSINRPVIVKKRPVALFTNRLSCSGNPTTFVDGSIANSDSIQSWAWNFAGLGSSTEKNPKFEFPSAGFYTTILQVTNNNGCIDADTIQTQVNPSPVASFKADSACLGTATIFTNQSTVAPPYQITNYSWDYGDESQSIQVSQPHLYTDYGIYSVRLAVRSSNQCLDTAIVPVQVFSNPTIDFTISNTQCTGKEIQFTDASSNVDGTPLNGWQWFFSGQGTSSSQNPKFTFNSQGNYTIQLTAKTAIGCSGSKFRSIAVTSPPLVNFSFTPTYGPPPLNVTYTNGSPNNSNYIWDYGDGAPTYTGYTAPPHSYTIRGSYSIKLLATDFKGCSDSLVKNILVDNAVIDGVMVSVTIIPDGDFYKVIATILNNSNIEITTLGLTIHLANGSDVREIWTGVLKPGNSVVYPFTGELRYDSQGDIPVICATIESVNVNAVESDVSNNSTCKEITVGSFDVLSVYPNPSTDNVNFGVMIPADGEVEITVYDLLGQLEYAIKFNGARGYNNFRLPTFSFNDGLYVAEVKYNSAVIRKKIMRGGK